MSTQDVARSGPPHRKARPRPSQVATAPDPQASCCMRAFSCHLDPHPPPPFRLQGPSVDLWELSVFFSMAFPVSAFLTARL